MIYLLLQDVFAVVLLYIFLFSHAHRALVLSAVSAKTELRSVDVENMSRPCSLHVDILGPVVIGRSPSSDIVIDEPTFLLHTPALLIQGPALVLGRPLDPQTEPWLMVTSSSSLLPFRDTDEVHNGDDYALDAGWGLRFLPDTTRLLDTPTQELL